jgi:hypothetical protein
MKSATETRDLRGSNLVPKLQLGNAKVIKAPALRFPVTAGVRFAKREAGASQRHFVPKQELGKEI